MFKVLAFLVIAVASASAFWTTCNVGPGPTSITSPACSGASCSVTRGEQLVASIVFSPPQSTPTLGVSIRAYFLGAELNIPNSPGNDDACNSVQPGCPTTAGAPHTWPINVPIPTTLPAINGFFTFTLAHAGTIVMCANVTASLL